MIRVRKAKVGSDIEISILDRHGSVKKQQWKVMAAYPYYVVAERNGECQSFNIGELVQYGVEQQSNRRLDQLVESVNAAERGWTKYA